MDKTKRAIYEPQKTAVTPVLEVLRINCLDEDWRSVPAGKAKLVLTGYFKSQLDERLAHGLRREQLQGWERDAAGQQWLTLAQCHRCDLNNKFVQQSRIVELAD